MAVYGTADSDSLDKEFKTDEQENGFYILKKEDLSWLVKRKDLPINSYLRLDEIPHNKRFYLDGCIIRSDNGSGYDVEMKGKSLLPVKIETENDEALIKKTSSTSWGVIVKATGARIKLTELKDCRNVYLNESVLVADDKYYFLRCNTSSVTLKSIKKAKIVDRSTKDDFDDTLKRVKRYSLNKLQRRGRRASLETLNRSFSEDWDECFPEETTNNVHKLMKVGGLWIIWCKSIDEYFEIEAENELYLNGTIIRNGEVFDIEVHGKTLVCVKLADENKDYYLKKTSPSSWSLICKETGVSSKLTDLKGSQSAIFKEAILTANGKQYMVEKNGDGKAFLKLIRKAHFVDRSTPEHLGDRSKRFLMGQIQQLRERSSSLGSVGMSECDIGVESELAAGRENIFILKIMAGQWIIKSGYLDNYFYIDRYTEKDVLSVKGSIIRAKRDTTDSSTTANLDEVFDIEIEGNALICVLISGENKEFYLKKTRSGGWMLICKDDNKETKLPELKNCQSVEIRSTVLVADAKQYLIQRNSDGEASVSLIQETNLVDRSNPDETDGDRSFSFKRFLNKKK